MEHTVGDTYEERKTEFSELFCIAQFYISSLNQKRLAEASMLQRQLCEL